MANHQTHTRSLSGAQFLLVAANLLKRAFIDAPRTLAKQQFRELERGVAVALPTLQLEDRSAVRFTVVLDHSEFRGTFNYSAFRASLLCLLQVTALQLREPGRAPAVFTDADSGAWVFGLPAHTVAQGLGNVLLLGAAPAEGDCQRLRLLYVDPAQFASTRDRHADAGR